MMYTDTAEVAFKIGFDVFNSEWIVTLGDKVISLSEFGEPLVNSAFESTERTEALEAAVRGGMTAIFGAAALTVVAGLSSAQPEKWRLKKEWKRLWKGRTLKRKRKRLWKRRKGFKRKKSWRGEGILFWHGGIAADSETKGICPYSHLMPELRANARKKPNLKDEDVNIAVVGQVSAGKTFFINGARGFPWPARHLKLNDTEYGPGQVSHNRPNLALDTEARTSWGLFGKICR
jgi:hypothetical protein